MKKILLVGMLWGLSLFADEMCRFNIGGYAMDIPRETAEQSSLLKATLRGTSVKKDQDGRFFINQIPEHGQIAHWFLCNGELPLNTPLETALSVAEIFGLDGIYLLFSYEPVA